MTGDRAVPGRGKWPLVGREQVLRTTVSILRRRDGAGLVLVGEEGVGKSRLAAEVLRQVEPYGMAVVHTVATSAAASLPFGALADLLPADVQQATSPFELMRLAAQYIRAAAPRQGLVLAVDDAHLLDAASAALVAHAVRSSAARALLVVREPAPAADALVGLLKDGPCERVRVDPLSDDDFAQLCAAALGGPVEGATLRRLSELSAGNLLYLYELIDAALSDRTLRAEGGVWHLRSAPRTGPRLSQIIESRLTRLDDSLRTVAEITALAGTVEVALLERLVGVQAVVAAERARLIDVTADGRRLRARPRHPLYAEVLRASTPLLAARLHRQGLARELAATGCRRKDDLLRLALQHLEAGDPPEEMLFSEAARAAAQLFDVHLAVRLATAAAEASGGFEARLAVAEALYAAGRCEEAEPLLVALEAVAADDVQRGRLALVHASNLISGFGRAAEAEALARDAREALDDGELRDELAALGGVIALSRGRPRQALHEVEPLLSRPGLSERATLRALLVAMSAWAQVGRADTAAATAQELFSEAPKRDLPVVFEAALVGLCYAQGVAGRLDEAERLANARWAAALEQRAPDLRTLWGLALGQAALARGDLAVADAKLREAALLLRYDQSIFGVYSLAWCLGCLAEMAATRGDATEARATLQEACAVTPEPCFIPARELARIWVAWAVSSGEAAAAAALDVAAHAQELGIDVVEAIALHHAARFGRAEEVLPRLAELAEHVDGRLIPAHAAHAAALVRGDADLLSDASHAYERLGVWLDGAEAAAQAAAAYRADGRRASATRAAQRSINLAARCPGARTPGLLLAVETRPLTTREREIASLAARGLTTPQIADELVLSARTVENHLHRTYTKLGVSSRVELADLLSHHSA